MDTNKNASASAKPLLPWLFLLCGALFYAYQFALRVYPSVMTEELLQSFKIGLEDLSRVISFYYFGYAAFLIPAGALLDKFGVRRVTLSAIACCILGAVLFTYVPHLFVVSLGRFLMGAGSAFAFLACLKIATLWFLPAQLPGLVGLSIFLGTMGAMGGGSPVAWGVENFGWKSTLFALIVIAIGLFSLTWAFLKDKKEEGDGASAPKESLLKGIQIVLKNKATLIVGLYAVLMYVPLAAFCDLWGVPYMVTAYKISETEAGFLVSLVYLGLGVMSPFGGMLANLFKSYRVPMLLSAFLTTIIFVLFLMKVTFSFSACVILLFLLGVFLAPQMLFFTVAVDSNPPRLGATVGGVVNTFSMLSGVIFQPLIGKILAIFAVGGTYTAVEYRWALSLIPLMTATGFFVPLWIKDTWQKEASVLTTKNAA
jgi:MFS family permease